MGNVYILMTTHWHYSLASPELSETMAQVPHNRETDLSIFYKRELFSFASWFLRFQGLFSPVFKLFDWGYQLIDSKA